jgi:diguanylate cyclase (GGDEF)-like protein/PAS domain S-box-containing protein
VSKAVPPVESEGPSLPSAFPPLALLGLATPQDGDWERLRALQAAQITAGTGPRIAVHVCAAIATIALYWTDVMPIALLAWALLLGGGLFQAWTGDRALGQHAHSGASQLEIRKQIRGSLALALVWAVPPLGFGLFAEAVHMWIGWGIVAAVCVYGVVARSAVPLGTLLVISIMCLAQAIAFGVAQQWAGPGIVIAFAAICVLGTLETSRLRMRSAVAEAGMEEKSEVVSLLLREFEEGEADWLWQVDTARRVRSVSPRFAFALGRTAEEVDGKPFVQLISGEAWETGQFPPSLHDLAERMKRRESFSNLVVQVTIGRTRRFWELSGTPIVDPSGRFTGYRGVGSDVTEQRESNEKIERLARFDTLTGLPNRMMLTEALGDAMTYAAQWRTRCAFMMIDLDRFKAVNDSLGHQVGDKMLEQVSKRLRSVMSENELCGRLGGDEFAIVVRDAADPERLDKVARMVIERLSQPYEIDRHTLYVGASVGSAVGPRDGQSVETLMRNADLALYRAKDEGGSVHCRYQPSLHADAEERRQLEFALRRALEREELFLNFQPVVDSNSEELVSFEALLRWKSAEHGMVSPAKLIPLAEDTRLIVPIGEWVLREACHEATRWPAHIRVAVNVSGEQLLDPKFAASVVNALQMSGLAASRLEIEVTESIFVRDDVTAKTALEQVMALGCSVALDDFGTGYSSLGYLRRLQFSTIKIDRSFVQGVTHNNPESLAIIRAVVAMADSLEMTTTAEGVESPEEAALIRDMGCTKIQGYYFGRPMDARDALRLTMQADPRQRVSAA